MLNLRKKLLVSVFTLMIAVVAVATTTYAWFTMGTTTNVSNIGMGVQSAEGLMIRVESVNGDAYSDGDSLYEWRTAVDLSTVFTSTNTLLQPVSMANRLSAPTGTVANKLYSLGFDASNAVTYTEATEGYIEIVFGFYSMTALNVRFETITPEAVGSYSFTTPVGYAGSGDFDGTTYSKGDAISNTRLANAIRIATTTGASDYSIINPLAYDSGIDEYGTWAGAAYSFFNATNSIPFTSAPAEYTYDITGADQAAAIEALQARTLTTLSGDSSAGYFGTVKVLIWLEGWDADCFNPVILDKANLNFQFTGVATA